LKPLAPGIIVFEGEIMNELKRNGPEFAPLREYNKECKIVVTIYDKNDVPIRVEHMDYGKKDDRNWLGKLSVWAWTNGHEVSSCLDD